MFITWVVTVYEPFDPELGVWFTDITDPAPISVDPRHTYDLTLVDLPVLGGCTGCCWEDWELDDWDWDELLDEDEDVLEELVDCEVLDACELFDDDELLDEELLEDDVLLEDDESVGWETPDKIVEFLDSNPVLPKDDDPDVIEDDPYVMDDDPDVMEDELELMEDDPEDWLIDDAEPDNPWIAKPLSKLFKLTWLAVDPEDDWLEPFDLILVAVKEEGKICDLTVSAFLITLIATSAALVLMVLAAFSSLLARPLRA